MADGAIIVVGGGSAGVQTAKGLARGGRRVVITDPGTYGGTCVWRGCVPKKALYKAAAVHRELLRPDRLGIEASRPDAGEHPVDWRRLLAWQRDVMRAYGGDQEGSLRDLGVTVLHGAARFRSPHEVDIDGEPYRTEHVVVATGSRPVLPDIPGRELLDTSDQALFYPEQPRSLVVVGGGYIAMELAGIYAAFGTGVHLVVRGRHVLEPIDPECAQVALEGLQDLGVAVHLETSTLGVQREGGTLVVRLRGAEGGEWELRAERILAATGRRPALDGIDLAAAGVELDQRGGPKVLASLRAASDPRVWFAGDAAGGPQLTPVASHEGGHVAQAILSGVGDPVDLSTVPSTCFTEPQVARTGVGERELAAQGVRYQVARGGFASTAQAIIEGERRGLVKLLADGHGRLLGAHLAGPEAAELIYGLALGLRAGLTLGEIQATDAVHPSLAEAVNWAAYSVETVEPAVEPAARREEAA